MNEPQNGAGIQSALKAAHGRGDGLGGKMDTRGIVAMLEARKRGITNPDELRRISSAAKR